MNNASPISNVWMVLQLFMMYARVTITSHLTASCRTVNPKKFGKAFSITSRKPIKLLMFTQIQITSKQALESSMQISTIKEPLLRRQKKMTLLAHPRKFVTIWSTVRRTPQTKLDFLFPTYCPSLRAALLRMTSPLCKLHSKSKSTN